MRGDRLLAANLERASAGRGRDADLWYLRPAGSPGKAVGQRGGRQEKRAGGGRAPPRAISRPREGRVVAPGGGSQGKRCAGRGRDGYRARGPCAGDADRGSRATGRAIHRLVARDLLAGDRRRALEELEAQATALRREAYITLLAALEPTLESDQRFGHAEEESKSAIAAAIPEFFEPKLAEISGTFGREVEE